MAEMVKAMEASKPNNEPVAFQPDQIRKIGAVGLSAGRPAIYFSGHDTAYLAEQMGHTIVGKFSHSLPASFQIQRTLGSIKFAKPFTWNYINAKHIAIKFEDVADYAKMLNGPNGMPVWSVEHHPMRVFKWSPEFDPFFETPMAAVWCNLIALPIHLFEKSALYAIGGLLGNPIQIDQATATKSRLSFARICVEIDISKPQPDEIILDILGKEMVQKVKWDRIPLYCNECKHVGHSSTTCYAFGKREMPAKKNYYPPQHKQQNQSFNKTQQRYNRPGKQTENGNVKEMEQRHINGKAKEHMRNETNHNLGGEKDLLETLAMSSLQTNQEGSICVDEEGFQKQGRRRGRQNHGHKHGGNHGRSRSIDGENKPHDAEKILEREVTSIVYPRAYSYQGPVGYLEQPGFFNKSLQEFAKPKYFRQLENGEFDTGEFEEDIEMEEDPYGAGSNGGTTFLIDEGGISRDREPRGVEEESSKQNERLSASSKA